ncbi:MAG: inositol 2-dehydrogenase [Alphaproteobacteria bacterium]|mgnify:FL=1|jgi:myo-inositol 2-dehydrogenase / D-chiro-inositol 1-dehydrogenase|nr:inositol 2-dehydrogenase [Alphaproteobacteria bacterium]MBU1551354.1 inositol 2-dehydrogenase [Alphaproteobacteria bacterium]MBU2336547.1 inositol 2-dehydrogenase [Alphaproteobacteria bacterium]MBU2387961.1 inositol 2-dehydrogenase [Alphaproteobacteria bacterium]
MTLKFALLGAGRIGKVHARAISGNPDAELSVVADASAEAAKAISDQYGCRVSTIDTIAADPMIDAVIICTPTNTHADLIETFARARKAIFCEKPVDLDVARAQACLEVVRDTGAKLMLGFQRRHDPHFSAVKKAIEDGRIGEVEMIQIVSRDPGAPPIDYIKTSGGIFRDMTIHDFDMARFLLSEEPVSVYATASVLTDKAIVGVDFDSASVTLMTASGKHCTISNSRRATYGYDQRVEVHGSRGMICVENQRPVTVELATAAGFSRPALHDFFMTRYVEAYAAEIAAFVSVVKNGVSPSPGGEDGLRALMLADAALRSASQGVVVSL